MSTLTDFPLNDSGKLDLTALARTLLEEAVNAAMYEQAVELGAENGVSLNGYRERRLTTVIGDITLRIPKLREGTYFPDDIVERWSRTDTALASTICEMWVNGVSNRKVDAIAREMGIERISRSKVSRLCRMLDAEVAEVRSSDLSGTRWPYLWLDATYVKCREAGAARSSAVVAAIAVDERARRRVVGLECMDTESYVAWRDFLIGLRKRGIAGVELVISDDHLGLVRAVREIMIGASWQRCIAHLERNVADRVRRRDTGAAAVSALKAAFAETEPALVAAGYDRACELLRAQDAAGADLLDAARDDALAYLAFPREHRNWIRTNNMCERMNGELKRRVKAVQVFPSNESMMRLVGAICCEQNDEWASEKWFIDPRSMVGLAARRTPGEVDGEEKMRVIRHVEEAFERKQKVA